MQQFKKILKTSNFEFEMTKKRTSDVQRSMLDVHLLNIFDLSCFRDEKSFLFPIVNSFFANTAVDPLEIGGPEFLSQTIACGQHVEIGSLPVKLVFGR